MLALDHLTTGYGRHIVQRNLNLKAAAGELICIIGTNGVGKSTLLRTVAGLLPPLEGSVTVQNRDVYRLSTVMRATLLSLVLTDVVNVENMSVHHLVALGRFPYTSWTGRISREDEQIVVKALQEVNLMHKRQSMINAISDGEKQRAMIARALAQDTPLVLLDEPTAHLDLPNRIEIMLLLRRLSVGTGKTFILSTHELDLALQMADQIWLMQPDCVHVGIPEDLMLSGLVQSAFSSERFRFDVNDGHYTINHFAGQFAVSVIGQLPAAAWMKRALIRCGVQITDHAKNIIEATGNGFLLNGKQTDTIEQTLASLRIIAQTQLLSPK
jgi:iron complex transport system ATP-binding protein